MTRVRSSMKARLALGAGSLLLAIGLPSSVVAIGLLDSNDALGAQNDFASFTPASADPRLAKLVAERSGGKAPLMRFTPAGAGGNNADRSVTVAVRVNQTVAQAIAGGSSIDGSQGASTLGAGLRIAPTRYNLGLARGYNSFAQSSAPTLSTSLSEANIPDLSEFQPAAGAAKKPSRFAPRIALENDRNNASASETSGLDNGQLLDVGGSFRLTRNLDVTAGVRIEQDRELQPLPDFDKQDSQAVYIGTQFRF